MNIGILALQGSVREHQQMLERLGIEVTLIRQVPDLEYVQGVIFPGGESTAQSKLLQRFGIFDVLKKKIQNGLPVWGTCAGAILLAKEIRGKNVPDSLQMMDILADRNAYGAQTESFIAEVEVGSGQRSAVSNQRPRVSGERSVLGFSLPAVFIRAPKLKALSESVQVLSIYQSEQIALRQGNMLATSFHPELVEDTKMHEYFVEMCRGASRKYVFLNKN